MSVTTTVDEVTSDVMRLRYMFVNVYFVGTMDEWILVDAGLQGCADDIVEAAEERFGKGTAPTAIVLTHGHFDHVGGFPELFERWNAPVYAHSQEMPHLTGKADYAEPDPSADSGVMALMSFAFPNKANDFGHHVQPLAANGSVPGSADWRWIHTPGHTEGHVSLFRDSDRVLIAGDAFVTVDQASLYAVSRQKQELHGPPSYFTPDWKAARSSLAEIVALEPSVGATGHGTPMHGAVLTEGLQTLLNDFDDIAMPDQGKYVPE